MEEKNFAFEGLNVYKEARLFVKMVYTLLKNFPAEEKYALSDQLRRASVSVISNIAEGSSRSSDKEQRHFLEMSYGSLMEVYCQLQVAFDLNYINEDQLKGLTAKIVLIAKLLSGLRHRFES